MEGVDTATAGFVGAANVLHGEVIDGHVHLGSMRIPGAAHLDEGAAAAAFVRPHDVVVTSDDGGTREVLRQARYQFVEGEALNVGVEDRPGALAALAGRLGQAGVNINGVVLLGRNSIEAAVALLAFGMLAMSFATRRATRRPTHLTETAHAIH